MTSDLHAQFCGAIRDFFGRGRCFLLAKGRVGLYAGLQGLALPKRAQVLMPGYTCMVVPAAVQFAGLEPAYVDIDPETYNLDPRLVAAQDAAGFAALIVQHTYGVPCDMTPLQAWAQSGNLPVLEDCCHAFGTRYAGRLCGTFGAFAFLSGQWNKPFSTGLGGLLLVNDAPLAERVEHLLHTEAHAPSWTKNVTLALQILAHQTLVRPSTALKITELYRAANRWGLAVGSSSPAELAGLMPPGYLTMMAPCQMRQGLREMAHIAANIRHRLELTAFYQTELPRLGLRPLAAANVCEWPLLRYPVRVANKAEVLARAVQARVEIGSWFELPLHPEGTRMEQFGYRQGMCPEAERAAREVINLPTHRKVSLATAAKTLDFLHKYGRPAAL